VTGCGTAFAGSETALRPVPTALPGIADVVLVASGKGGVGKSTITVNLAIALRARGRRVGILDADLYGPSIARMLGTGDGIVVGEDGRPQPAASHGVHSISVGNLLPPESPMAWKGPLAVQALMQLFRDVAWPELDILLVDLPPGTGDVQISILEQIAVSGAVVVTTPQRLATVDAERAIAMFHELDVPVFGLVENMDGYVCPCCGKRQTLFPAGGAATLARRRHVAYLGGIPLDAGAQGLADGGTPLIAGRPDGEAARAFAVVAEKVTAAVGRERKARAADPAAQGESRKSWEGDARHDD
jgi:ATP-binding protein involved in chromosome partitioning